jgi:hemoglobin/transferrin/lactoferrin receptor protein
MKMLYGFVVGIFLCASLSAQQELLSLDENDLSDKSGWGKSKVISASRTLQNLEDLPVTVYIVTREDILRNGYNSLADVLKDVPGMKVTQPGSATDGEMFIMNGLYGNYYCKILVNDIPIMPSVAGGMPVGEQLPVRQAERIEIIFGPSTAVYGSDALSGVINIVTKTSERPVWSQADITLGNYGYYNLNVMIGGKVGKSKNVLDYSFFGSYGHFDDMNIKNDVEGVYDPGLYGDSAEYAPFYKGDPGSPEMNRLPQSSRMLGFDLKYRGIRFNFLHLGRSMHSSVGQATNRFAYYDPLNLWGEKIDRYSLNYSLKNGKISSVTNLSYLLYRLDNQSSFRFIYDYGDNGRVYKYMASDDLLLEEILSYSVRPQFEITTGFSGQYSGNLPKTNDLSEPFDTEKYKPFSEEVDADDPLLGSFGVNPVTFYNLAGFLQMFYKTGKLSFIAGTRLDHHSLFGSAINPRVGIQYKISTLLSARTSYGSGFRAPSLYYLYNSLAYQDDNGIVYENIPNPGANPENFHQVDLGFRYHPVKKLDIEWIILYHYLNDNLTYTLVNVDSSIYPLAVNKLAFSAINDDKSMAELFLTQFIFRSEEIVEKLKLNADLYLTFSKGKEILPGNLGTLQDYRNYPLWMVQFNIDFQPLNNFTVILNNSLSGVWKKRFFPFDLQTMEALGLATETKGYYTLDLVARYQISNNFQTFLKINNVTDNQYGGTDATGSLNDLTYNPQYGRFYHFGLSFRME